MDEGRLLDDRGLSGRWRSNLLGLAVLVVALIGALMVSVATAGSQGVTALSGGSTVQDVGTLELFASDADGDGFDFADTGGATTDTEIFTTDNRSRLGETDLPQNLVTLTPNDGATNQTYVGLKDHTFGVRERGEGSGTPAAQINGDQTLTIDLDGGDLPGDGASFAELALKFKFGATVSIQAFDATGDVDDPVLVTCDGGGTSDCGSDSGADRDVVRVPTEGEASRPFTGVVISISEPSDGAVSLIDDPGFETFFNIVEHVSADLSIAKTVDDETPDEGDAISYTVTVTYESGNGPTTDLVVSDVLPAGVTVGTPSATDGTYDGTTWSGFDLVAGESATLTIPATVDAGTAGTTITNTATLTDTTEDDSNDSASAAITVNAVDLAISKTVDDDLVYEGATVVYTVTATNLSGNTAATGVTVTDTLPAGLTFVSTNGCAEDPVGAPTCTLPDIPVLGSESYDITATVDAVTSPSVTLTNTASVTASETDTDDTNNSSAPVSIVATPALSCGETISQAEGGYASDFTRLNLGADELDGCETEPSKPYFQDIVDNADIGGDPDGFRIEFEPQGDEEDEAIYRGVLTFPAGLEDDFRPSLRYDEDGFADATVSFVSMQGCVPTPAGSDPGLTALAAEFSGELPAGIYPEMPAGETACSVSVSSVIGGNEIWVIRVDYDPWFRR